MGVVVGGNSDAGLAFLGSTVTRSRRGASRAGRVAAEISIGEARHVG